VAQLVKCATPPSTKHRLSGRRSPDCRRVTTCGLLGVEPQIVAVRQSGERLPESRCFVEGGVAHFTSCATFPQSALRKGGATGKVRHATLNTWCCASSPDIARTRHTSPSRDLNLPKTKLFRSRVDPPPSHFGAGLNTRSARASPGPAEQGVYEHVVLRVPEPARTAGWRGEIAHGGRPFVRAVR